MERFTGGCPCGDVRSVATGLPYRVCPLPGHGAHCAISTRRAEGHEDSRAARDWHAPGGALGAGGGERKLLERRSSHAGRLPT